MIGKLCANCKWEVSAIYDNTDKKYRCSDCGAILNEFGEEDFNCWRIPNVVKGDNIVLIKDIPFSNKLVLKKDEIFAVSDIGIRYGLPFIYVEELGHELQLQPRSYKKL